MSATFMLELDELGEPHATLLARIASSAKRTIATVGDLLDFTSGRLGGGMPIVRAEADLAKLVQDVAGEICAAHPGRKVRVDARGDARGQWDAARISQAVGNLIANAVQHGVDDSEISVAVQGEAAEVTIAVHNRGSIPAGRLDGIFNPMKSSRTAQRPAPSGAGANLGLGLYIAQRIVAAHAGRIDVESTDAAETTFTLHLPREGSTPTTPPPASAPVPAPAPAADR